MGQNGGARPGSGRKSKAEELKLIEKLSPMEPTAMKALEAGVKKGEFPYLKLFFEYYFGRPTEIIDLEHSGEIKTTSLDPTKLSDDTIRELLNARRGDHSTNGVSKAKL